MRILIAGTGGVGGYFGALLARAGRDVVFLARGRNLAALRERGLTVESVDGDMRLPHVTATDTLADAAPVDLVLVTVKSYDTSATAAVIAPVVTRETILLSLQNGIENEGVLAAALGLPPLLGAMTQIGAELTAPGVVRHVAQGTIFFGETNGRETARTPLPFRLRDLYRVVPAHFGILPPPGRHEPARDIRRLLVRRPLALPHARDLRRRHAVAERDHQVALRRRRGRVTRRFGAGTGEERGRARERDQHESATPPHVRTMPAAAAAGRPPCRRRRGSWRGS